MANKKKSVPNDVKTELEEQKVEETAVAETEPVEQTAEAVTDEASAPEKSNAFVDGLKSFGGKTKNFFVNIGVKTKTVCRKVFKKNKGEAAADETAQPQDSAEAAAAAVTFEQQLPLKVRAGRFIRSQSGWLFVLPAVILMLVFTLWPIVSAFINAFKQDYRPLDINNPFNGWGFANFGKVLRGDTGTGGASFVQCLVNTLVFTFVSVPLSTLLALLISVALTSIKPLQKAYQTVLFLPYLTNSLAMGAVFATFFAAIGTDSHLETPGIVNLIFGTQINWIGKGPFTSPKWVLGDSLTIPWAKYIVVIVYEVWSGLPFKILILFSSLMNVNKQYYDAAKIDGANKNTVLWKITVPMISPMISYLLVTGIMGGMKQYSAVVGIFGEQMGIEYDVGTMVGYIYRYIEDGNMGYAYAGSLLLFIIIMAITALNRYVSKKKVSY